MAVSLKKSDKVDLSKPEAPPKIREYTPKHLIDEEQTIVKRPRQPPVQLHFLEDNSIEVFSDEKELKVARKNFKELLRKYQYPFLISISVACLIVLVVLLIRTFSPTVPATVENAPNMTVSAETSTYSAPVESVSAESSPINEATSLASSPVEILLDTTVQLISHPAVILILGLSMFFTIIQIVMKIMRC